MNIFTKIKQLRCKHLDCIPISNICGDFVNEISPIGKTYRCAYECLNCGKIIYKETYNDDCKIVNFKDHYDKKNNIIYTCNIDNNMKHYEDGTIIYDSCKGELYIIMDNKLIEYKKEDIN